MTMPAAELTVRERTSILASELNRIPRMSNAWCWAVRPLNTNARPETTAIQ